MEQEQTSWDLVADVVVVGSGGAGLPAAIAAIDSGASVIVVEANYDIGGHAIVSGGNTALGGGRLIHLLPGRCLPGHGRLQPRIFRGGGDRLQRSSKTLGPRARQTLYYSTPPPPDDLRAQISSL